jgi:hypothetical protein
MNIRNQLLAFAITAALGAAPTTFAQVNDASPATPPAGEQTPPPQSNSPSDPTAQPSQSPTAQAEPIDDQKIEQFASAYTEVATIQRNANAELAKANDTTQAEEVKANAESQMIAAVERNGLDVNEFNRIVERMAADDSVRSRVAAKIQERSAAGPETAP